MNITPITKKDFFVAGLTKIENNAFDSFTYFVNKKDTLPFVYSLNNRGIFKYDEVIESLSKSDYDFELFYQTGDQATKTRHQHVRILKDKEMVGILVIMIDNYSMEVDSDETEDFVSDAVLYYDPKYADEIIGVFDKAWKDNEIEITDTPHVRILVKDMDELDLRDYPITEGYKMVEPDLHYGEGFEDFHNALIEKVKSRHDGLVMLHGEPGTGKSFYIRYLLQELLKADKDIVYIPPSFIGALTDPGLITFFTDWIGHSSKKLVLLIEDCEELFIAREGYDGRNTAMANLLNLTQGILNDILKIQVIATFNTQLDNIDKALLRPERLIARKEFRNLTPEEATKLSKTIKTNKEYTEDTSLAEIYSTKNEREILIHNKPKERKQIGFSRN